MRKIPESEDLHNTTKEAWDVAKCAAVRNSVRLIILSDNYVCHLLPTHLSTEWDTLIPDTSRLEILIDSCQLK